MDLKEKTMIDKIYMAKVERNKQNSFNLVENFKQK